MTDPVCDNCGWTSTGGTQTFVTVGHRNGSGPFSGEPLVDGASYAFAVRAVNSVNVVPYEQNSAASNWTRAQVSGVFAGNTLSVANASASEGPNAVMEFRVRLA